MFNIRNFNEVSPLEAKGALAALDKVAIVPLYEQLPWNGGNDAKLVLKDDDGIMRASTVKNAPKVYGVKNVNTGVVHFGAAKNYAVLNHEDAFAPVLDGAEHLGLRTLINIENNHDVVQAYILFPDLVVNDHADGIQMGVRFKNVYNDKKSFKGSAFSWRLACSNGAIHSAEFQDLQVAAWHSEKQINALPLKIADFINGILQRSHLLEVQIEAAIESPVKFLNYAEIANTLAPITESQKIAALAAEKIEDPAHTNRWELFNAVTEVASHAPGVSFITRDRLLDSADKRILNVGAIAPIPVPVAAV